MFGPTSQPRPTTSPPVRNVLDTAADTAANPPRPPHVERLGAPITFLASDTTAAIVPLTPQARLNINVADLHSNVTIECSPVPTHGVREQRTLSSASAKAQENTTQKPVIQIDLQEPLTNSTAPPTKEKLAHAARPHSAAQSSPDIPTETLALDRHLLCNAFDGFSQTLLSKKHLESPCSSTIPAKRPRHETIPADLAVSGQKKPRMLSPLQVAPTEESSCVDKERHVEPVVHVTVNDPSAVPTGAIQSVVEGPQHIISSTLELGSRHSTAPTADSSTDRLEVAPRDSDDAEASSTLPSVRNISPPDDHMHDLFSASDDSDISSMRDDDGTDEHDEAGAGLALEDFATLSRPPGKQRNLVKRRFGWHQMIGMALLGAPRAGLTAREMQEWIDRADPSYHGAAKSSVNAVLCQRKEFTKSNETVPGEKALRWVFAHEDYREEYRKLLSQANFDILPGHQASKDVCNGSDRSTGHRHSLIVKLPLPPKSKPPSIEKDPAEGSKSPRRHRGRATKRAAQEPPAARTAETSRNLSPSPDNARKRALEEMEWDWAFAEAAKDCSTDVNDLYEARPHLRPEAALADREARLAQIKARPSRKQMFGKPILYARRHQENPHSQLADMPWRQKGRERREEEDWMHVLVDGKVHMKNSKDGRVVATR